MPDLLHRLRTRIAAWDAEATDAASDEAFCRDTGRWHGERQAREQLRQARENAALDRAMLAELRVVQPGLPGLVMEEVDG